MRDDRIARLAKRLDRMAQVDEKRIRRQEEIEQLRRQAAAELHTVCASFVQKLSGMLTQARLELSPATFTPEMLRDPGPNIFQISASGRIVQLAFETTEPLVSTENYSTPYILEGGVRWFNEESLEGIGPQEHLLFHCLGGQERQWIHYDAQTHRAGLVNEEYLAERLEEVS